jgi:hypothetical protein
MAWYDYAFPVFSFGNQALGGLDFGNLNFGSLGGLLGGGDVPEAPDYQALLNQMAQANQRNLYMQTMANRPNMETPWGSVSWSAPTYQQFAGGSGVPSTGGYGGTGGATGGTSTGTRNVAPGGYPAPAPYTGEQMASISQPATADAASLSAAPRPATPPIDGRTGLPMGTGRGDSSDLPIGPNGYPVAPYPGTSPVDPGSIGPTGGAGTGGAGGAPGTSPWTMTMTLPEEMQKALESQQRLASGRSMAAEDLLGNVTNDLSNYNQFWGELPGMGDPATARQRAEDAIYQRATSRLDPMWGQRQSQTETQLANQGLTPGSTAYNNAMQNFNLGRNDAYQTAMNEAIMGGGSEATRQQQQELQARQQGISEGYQQQYGGMNALNALLGGQQVGMPSMPSFMGAGQAQTPNYFAGGQAQYQGALNQFGAGQAQLQNLMGGAAAMAPYFMAF